MGLYHLHKVQVAPLLGAGAGAGSCAFLGAFLDVFSTGGIARTRAFPGALDQADDIPALWRSSRASSAGGTSHTGAPLNRSRPVVCRAVTLFYSAPLGPTVVTPALLLVVIIRPSTTCSPSILEVVFEKIPNSKTIQKPFDRCPGA